LKKYNQIILDTETTSIDIEKAKLVWISIFLDEKNIFYINRMHSGKKVSDEKILDFIEKIFKMNILIIWHNIKYDLEILELFMKNYNNSDYSSDFKEEQKQISLTF
jgi:DNA polymerase I-like protein with 3'-5' exonuclease and polymerase domains